MVTHEGVDIKAVERLAAETPELCALEIIKDGRGLRVDQSLNPHPRGSHEDAIEALGVLYTEQGGMLRVELLQAMKQDMTADHYKAGTVWGGWTITLEAWGPPDQLGRLLLQIMRVGAQAWLRKALAGRS